MADRPELMAVGDSIHTTAHARSPYCYGNIAIAQSLVGGLSSFTCFNHVSEIEPLLAELRDGSGLDFVSRQQADLDAQLAAQQGGRCRASATKADSTASTTC